MGPASAPACPLGSGPLGQTRARVDVRRRPLALMMRGQVPGGLPSFLPVSSPHKSGGIPRLLIHSKGYGVRSLNTKQKVDENTLFGIASNSKAFTAAALGILIDEGKLKWDDKVTDYIPEFKMYNPYVTDEFTIRDLLTHRSGLGLGAGDLMFWPDSNSFTLKDVIHNLRYLKPVSGFRTK